MSFGKQLNLFLVDGKPGGLLTAEVRGWTGHITAAPRTRIKELLEREEASRTGVYILLGEDPEAPESIRAYIGEGDEIGIRLKSHTQPPEKGGKDFWDRAILMTSKDANLTKAHVLYLESRLIQLAKRAQRSQVENTQSSDRSQRLPEADIAVMESYLAELEIVLPMLGVNIFRQPRQQIDRSTQVTTAVTSSDAPIFYLEHKPSDRRARAQEYDGQFTVLEGSQAASAWTGVRRGYRQLLENLHKDGTLRPVPTKDYSVFTRDRVMSSVSAAGAMITGRATNGRTEWRIEDSEMTYAEWQNFSLGEDHTSA
ncbi:GIY-YIG nuclease family protein [Enteractinococcus coprophilus]|uniref:Uncharacterized protein DUF4357 n=2 Tax=Micrococcales TaxID=85006 RepID=A0A543AG36_9MICC|nr:GIY-YIG nuclease family protein [Enteractinococcus coprophilus]TQL71527.1 uncharacterized protein DUF4357 [Enteractinococcus coprophilus]